MMRAQGGQASPEKRDVNKWLGDVLGSWPERLDLVAVQRGQPVDDDLLGHVELFSHFGRVPRPAGHPLQVFEGQQEAGYFQADLTFNGRRLASIVAMLDMDCLVG